MAVRAVLERVLERYRDHSNVELAATLGVHESYVRKLRRSDWRPGRVADALWTRLQDLDPERPSAQAQPAAFYDGVLFAAQAMSETVTRLLAEARAGLHRGPSTPTAGEVVVGMQALDAAEGEALPAHPPRPRKGQSRSA